LKTIWHWHLPLKTASEANSSEHWTKKARRHRLQKKKIWAVLHSENPPIAIPCAIVLTRIAPRQLDSHDNLATSMKYVSDALAEFLIPNKAPGRADDSKEIVWQFKQEKGRVREYAIRIEIMMEQQ
jgi:hypothetical protein